ncbi:hypothetical protein Dd703_2516 [Musicola paradisiaca Ech703]|uniref:Uncharacterized protein n=1 Tax=Musicola paradisiaca (strain Ech703) TaxID=579405 RepID=C6C993_MUSP7|nr:hypothetical protein Dd703_2516 [Musicola paradisiaca Ech703]
MRSDTLTIELQGKTPALCFRLWPGSVAQAG